QSQVYFTTTYTVPATTGTFYSSFTFDAYLSAPNSQTVTVPLFARSSWSGLNYSIPTSITFAPLHQTWTGTIYLAYTSAVYSSTINLTVYMSTPVNATLGNPTTFTRFITDTNTPPKVSLVNYYTQVVPYNTSSSTSSTTTAATVGTVSYYTGQPISV